MEAYKASAPFFIVTCRDCGRGYWSTRQAADVFSVAARTSKAKCRDTPWKGREAMRSVLKYPGSKWNIVGQLVELILQHHSYVEPFFGSGAGRQLSFA